jgi:hypothetical protein
MSTGNLARSTTDHYHDAWTQFQREHPGSFRAEDFVDWAVSKGLLDEPKIDPRKILVRDAKRAMRSIKFTDAQGRPNIREMIPAKVPRVDSRGNQVFEVFWDHIYQMSLDHAFHAFEQLDENLIKQRRAATRNVESFLDNNPNATGAADQFVFAFMLEDPIPQAVEAIPESPAPEPPQFDADGNPTPRTSTGGPGSEVASKNPR